MARQSLAAGTLIDALSTHRGPCSESTTGYRVDERYRAGLLA